MDTTQYFMTVSKLNLIHSRNCWLSWYSNLQGLLGWEMWGWRGFALDAWSGSSHWILEFFGHFKNKWTSPKNLRWASPRKNWGKCKDLLHFLNGSCGALNVHPRHCKASTMPCALWPNSFTARATWLTHRSGSDVQRTRQMNDGWVSARQKLGGGNSKIFYFYPDTWGNHPIWRAYFSNGLVQPPTRKV